MIDRRAKDPCAQDRVTRAPAWSQAWGGSCRECLVAGPLPMGPGQVQPEKAIWAHPPVGPFIVGSLRHTCAIVMLSNQHLNMPHLWGGMQYLGKGEVLTDRDLDRFESNGCFVHVRNVSYLWIQLMKNGSKNRSVAFIFLFSVSTLTRHILTLCWMLLFSNLAIQEAKWKT